MAVTHVHLDPLGGIAGDMFLAALLDAFPEHADGAFAAMRAAGLPPDWRAALVPYGDGVLTGGRVVIEGPAGGAHGHQHGPGSFRAIRHRLGEAALPRPVAERAILIFAGWPRPRPRSTASRSTRSISTSSPTGTRSPTSWAPPG